MTTEEFRAAAKEAIEYRKKRFACYCGDPEDANWGSDFVLNVTWNGHQWTPLAFSYEEGVQVLKVLKEELRLLKKDIAKANARKRKRK